MTPDPSTDPSRTVEHAAADRTPPEPSAVAEGSSATVHAPPHVSLARGPSCLAAREKHEPNAWQTFNTRSMLGGALVGQKKFAEAEPLLRTGYEGMQKREPTIPPAGRPRLGEAVDRLIELAAAKDDAEAVKVWKAERARYLEPAPPPRARN